MRSILALCLLISWSARADYIGTAASNYTTGTWFVSIVGDSIAQGYTNYATILNGGPSGDTNFNIANRLFIYSTNVIRATNYGVNGRELRTVNVNDVNAALTPKPKWLLVHCGVNDIANGWSWADFSTNLNAIATKCANSNAFLMVDSIFPWNNGTDSQVLQVRQWNDLMNLWCRTNQTVRSVFVKSYNHMGQIRSSTKQMDDLASAYALGDGVHINSAAYAAWAEVLFNTLSAEEFFIPAERRARWDLAGVPGGIPARATVYTNLTATGNPGTDENAITNAIANCPTNQTVKLGSGTWYLTNTIYLKSGVTLRGAGMTSTILQNSNSSRTVSISASYSYDWDVGGLAANRVDWLANFTMGESNLQVRTTNWAAATTALPLGRLVFIDQLNDTNTSAIGAYGVNAGGYTSRAEPNTGKDRYQHFGSRIVSTNLGTNITIWPPVVFPNWQSASSPTIWYEGANPIESAGVEDMTVYTPHSDRYSVAFDNAWACWAKNVKATGGRRKFTSENISVQCEINSCVAENDSGSTDDYDWGLFQWFYGKVENCIGNKLDNHYLLNGSVASVFGYSYHTNSTSQAAAAMQGMFWTHGGHCSYNLIEGCVMIGRVSFENGWGSGAYNTIFRSRISGYDEASSGYSSGVQAVDVQATNRFTTIAGSVLGTTGKNLWYQKASLSDAERPTDRLYLLAIFNPYNESLGYDAFVVDSLVRHLNWISSTNLIAPTGMAFTNSVEYQAARSAVVEDMPKSLYLTAAPSFFGSITWPPVTPSDATYSSSITNLPAARTFIDSISAGGTAGVRSSRIRGIRLRP